MEQNQLFADLTIGDKRRLTRLCSENDMLVFANVSGNHNPRNLPDIDADSDAEEGILPAMFLGALISSVLGNLLPGPGTIYKRQSLSFHAPAIAGDEVVVEVEVIAKNTDKTIELKTTVERPKDNTLLVSGIAVVNAPQKKFEFDPTTIPGLIVQRHRHFEALLKQAEKHPPIPTAIVCPHEAKSLAGALAGHQHSLITPLLIGNRDLINATAKELGISVKDLTIHDVESDEAAAKLAVELARHGDAHAIMKGHLHTDTLLSPMMDKTEGLRTGRRITHVIIADVPGIDHPLLVSDAAINISPDLATKVDIVQNAIDVAHSIGIERPRVAILSAVEVINPKIQSSMDAGLLSKMADRNQITGGDVDGPLAMDNAIDLDAARTKGIRSTVAGRSDILIAPNLDAGNMLYKQLAYISHAEAAGLVIGAKVPVILNSRADGKMSRLASCAIAALHHYYHADIS